MHNVLIAIAIVQYLTLNNSMHLIHILLSHLTTQTAYNMVRINAFRRKF